MQLVVSASVAVDYVRPLASVDRSPVEFVAPDRHPLLMEFAEPVGGNRRFLQSAADLAAFSFKGKPDRFPRVASLLFDLVKLALLSGEGKDRRRQWSKLDLSQTRECEEKEKKLHETIVVRAGALNYWIKLHKN